MRKLLVVVDMQHDFVDGVLGTAEAQAIVQPMETFIKEFNGDILFTQDTHFSNYLETQEGQRLPVEHCLEHTEGWRILGSLYNAREKEPLFDENHRGTFRKGTFGSTELGKFVKAEDYDEIHFVGVCTGICVIANAVLAKSFDPAARIVIHKDLCACVTPESHKIALKAMETLQMDIV